MVDPLFWLGLSLLLVAVSLTAVLVAALPALRELSRAARSAEKLFDTLSRELPPTLEAIRLTGLEITDLTDEVSESVQSAGRVVRQVDRSVTGVRQQAQKARQVSRSLMVGVRAAWRSLTQPPPPSWSDTDRPYDQLPAHTTPPLEQAQEHTYEYDEYDEYDPYNGYDNNDAYPQSKSEPTSPDPPDPTWSASKGRSQTSDSL